MADFTAFVQEQFNKLRSKTYKRKKPAVRFREFIPPNPEPTPKGADSVTVVIFDGVGYCKWIGRTAKDIPRSDVNAKRKKYDVEGFATSWMWNLLEVQKAAEGGLDLKAPRRNQAFDDAEAFLQQVAYFGAAELGHPGLLNHPNIPIVLAHDAGANGTSWATKSYAECEADLYAIADNPFVTTNGIEYADTILLPSNWFPVLSQKTHPQTGVKLLTEFVKNHPTVKNIDWVADLNTAGPGGIPMALAYRRDPDVLYLEIPWEPEEQQTTFSGIEWTTPVLAKTGGTIVLYPHACAYMTGFHI